MQYLLFFLIFILITSFIGYPIVLSLLSFFAQGKVKKDDNLFPEVALLIAAYNEEETIEEKIKNSLSLTYPKDKLEIIVVSDGSTDKTDEIVKRYESQGIQLLRVEGRVGKTEARNQAVLKNKKEIIVFSDATAVYEKDVIEKMVRNFADPSVGMVSGNLSYFDKSQGNMSLATRLYWSYEKFIKKSQSRFYSLTGAVGCLNAFRRELYHVLPSNIIEDFTEPLMIIAKNYRIVYEEEAKTYERTTQKASQEFKMRVRVIRGGMTGFLYALKFLSLKKHTYIILQLFLHKVLRWLMPVTLLALFVVSFFCAFLYDNSLFRYFFLLQLVCYLLGTLGLLIKVPGLVGKVLSIPAYFIIVNAASLMALYKTLTSKLEATWETNVY